MVEVSNSDIGRILSCLDIAIAHYSALTGLHNRNQARILTLLKKKINRKIKKSRPK